MLKKGSFLRAFAMVFTFLTFACSAQDSGNETRDAMTNERLAEIVNRLDENAEGHEGFWQFSFDGVPLLLVIDARADRMRVISPIGDFAQEDLAPELLFRMLQANFDTTLDARYGYAQGKLWSVYIHPLSPLTDQQFLSGIGQTINLVKTFGSTYNSGALSFGGGDSQEQNRKLFEELQRRGEAL